MDDVFVGKPTRKLDGELLAQLNKHDAVTAERPGLAMFAHTRRRDEPAIAIGRTTTRAASAPELVAQTMPADPIAAMNVVALPPTVAPLGVYIFVGVAAVLATSGVLAALTIFR